MAQKNKAIISHCFSEILDIRNLATILGTERQKLELLG